VKERLKLESQVGENNKKVFHAFWQDTYQNGNLENEASTRNDLLGALRAIEPLSITTATKEELRTMLSALPAHQQRRYCIRVNQLLAFLGRHFTIEKKKRQHREVDFVTWDELQLILPHIKSPDVRISGGGTLGYWGEGE
jgi:hypothetical protein